MFKAAFQFSCGAFQNRVRFKNPVAPNRQDLVFNAPEISGGVSGCRRNKTDLEKDIHAHGRGVGLHNL